MMSFKIALGLLLLAMLAMVAESSWGKEKGPYSYDLSNKSDLNMLYNSKVYLAELFRRPLEGTSSQLGLISHSGVRYPSRIEKIDYDEGKMLVHFDRWSHRYDEWILWDSSRLRPLERPALRKEGLKEEEVSELRDGEEVLARWTDCRYYPAKIESINKEGTYTVQFYDGVIRCVKRIHIKSMPEDAKGQQDWIALVKAASAAAKNKGGNRPRTSANSNKDREDRREQRSDEELDDDDEEDDDSESEKLAPNNSPQRRRRSQRLATSSDQACPSSPHMRDSSTHPPPPPPPPPDDPQKAVEDSSTAVKTEAPPQKPASGSPSTAPPASIAQSPITEKDKMTDTLSSNQTTLEGNSPSVVTAAVQKVPSRTPKANKHAREPIINTKKSDDPTAPNECIIDLDHNKFKCKVPGCSKAFRKAKLLDYHLKYYHNTEKEMDSEVCSPERMGRTRATSASMPTSTLSDMPDNKRRRTVSTSSSLSSQGFMLQMDSSGCVRPPKFCKKKRSSASVSSDSTEVSLPPPTFDNLHDKIIKKEKHLDGLCIKTERKFKLEDKCQLFVKKRDKDRRDRKEKDLFRIKQKKKKKKKKKSKLHCYSDLDEMSLAYLDRPSSPIHRSSSSAFKHSTFQYPRAILSVDLTGENLSDIDFLEDSTTESLLFSGDEYNQDLDSIIMEDFQDEDDDGADEIVRCICEMDEENGFMIQCEECMCWQHSVCMGLLEDSIPDHYICYICRDPPGQRWSAKYRHDKDWLQKGHMYGLSFLTENYSHQNAKKIVSTHQLLADVYSVKNLLHGLQLKMDILQNKHNPSLHLWARSWVNSDEDQPMGGVPDCLHFKEHLNQNSNPETYITSEHSYQKPPGTGLEHTRDEQGMQMASQFNRKEEEVSNAIALSGCVNDSSLGSMEQARNCLQWQMNLLTHIEDVQNQLSGRMDLIEKELDVLESWLDFTGELEPPDPLARLPQLKCRIKQLLTDLGKVQQMSTLCSV
ncbi:PHD finger 20 1 isoform X1 [Labeo rohita]|uniref:PHD finger 20 1 isoform X1 n=1 Tax=Labeo rohita TaxID=84645 RepID=A0A498MG82_LABRO|nr:PHD finger 20 1 isoform X1 [Labeo rohita]